jgi:lipoate-protein ligase A
MTPPVAVSTAPDRVTHDASTAWVATTLAALAALRTSDDWGWVRLRRPAPTAAFSRRDTLTPGYAVAAEVAEDHGFTPLVRPVGGRLAAHHEGALVLDVLGRHPEPGPETAHRFEHFGTAVTTALRRLGVDARVGRVPEEYCSGEHSVNARGRVKLVGTAQRVTRGSFWLSAVLLVSDPDPVRAVLSATYPHLGLPFDARTLGSVADEVPGVSNTDVVDVLLQALGVVLPLGAVGPAAPGGPGEIARLALTGCWRTAR